MHTLSEILNVNHSNVYVRKSKIVNSISILSELLQYQVLTKHIQIPNQDIKIHLKSLKVQLKEVETLIKNHEQTSFYFGL